MLSNGEDREVLEWGSSDRSQPNVWFNYRTFGRLTLAYTLALVLAFVFSPNRAQAQSEDQVKAAFLFNFVRYVEWPSEVFEDDASDVKICMFKAEAFASVVKQTVSGKNVGDRNVEVDLIGNAGSTRGCHLLYVGVVGEESISDLVSNLGNAPIFTVSDAEGFAQSGGMANFFRTDSKIRFEMNPDAAKKANLKISSRLLRLARVVK